MENEAKPGLFSIGHSNHKPEFFLGLLRHHAIQTVVDVRTGPSSRMFPWFNRGALCTYLRQNGIDYFFAGDVLGGKSKLSVTNAQFRIKMDKLVDLSGTRCVAMMCSERDPCECHRASKLGAWLQREYGLLVEHIVPGVGLVDDAVIRSAIPNRRIWHELHPEGEYGTPGYEHAPKKPRPAQKKLPLA